MEVLAGTPLCKHCSKKGKDTPAIPGSPCCLDCTSRNITVLTLLLKEAEKKPKGSTVIKIPMVKEQLVRLESAKENYLGRISQLATGQTLTGLAH